MRRIAVLTLIGLALTPASARYTPAVSTSAISVLPSEQEVARQRAAEQRRDRAFCKEVRRAKGDSAPIVRLVDSDPANAMHFVDLVHSGAAGCPRDLNLTIALVEGLVAGESLLAANPERLGYLQRYLRERGLPADLARIAEIDRFLWVRWDNRSALYPEPVWSEQDRLAFLTRDDVWAYLSREDVIRAKPVDLRVIPWLDKRSSRFDPGMAVAELVRTGRPGDQYQAARILLDGKLLPADPVRAEVLLWEAAPGWSVPMTTLLDLIEPRLAGPITAEASGLRLRLRKAVRTSALLDPPVYQRIARLLLPDLENSDPAVQLDNAETLGMLYVRGVALVEGPLAHWIEQVLARPLDPRQTSAIRILTQVMEAGSLEARNVLDRDIARHGAIVDAGSYADDPSLIELGGNPANLLTSADYPVRGIRQEIEGTVECWVLISPSGRAVLVDVDPGSEQFFAATVRTIITRRMRWMTTRWPGRYVRVKLPPFQFRLAEPDGTMITPAIPGAILIDAKRIARPNPDAAIP